MRRRVVQDTDQTRDGPGSCHQCDHADLYRPVILFLRRRLEEPCCAASAKDH